MKKNIRSDNEFLDMYFDSSFSLINYDIKFKMLKIKKLILKSLKDNNSIFTFGNGASNLIASHFALDLSNQLGTKCFCFNSSEVITAFSNDFGYENSIERYIKIYCKKGDLLFFISSSGMSPNIVKASEFAMKLKCKIITLTGFSSNNYLSKNGDINIHIDSTIYNIVESLHNMILSYICDISCRNIENIGKHGRII